MKKLIISLSAFALAASAATAQELADQWVTIVNGPSWSDQNGNVVQAHGPGFLLVDGTWYMIGEDRGKSRPDVNMYSSTDLQHWTFERKIIEGGVTNSDLGRSRMIERPKIGYCPATGQYVVWCHWESSNYSASQAACFYSDVINGPYTYKWAGRPLNIKSRDCNFFVDNDGSAYFISTTNENQDLGLFTLSDDFLTPVRHDLLLPGQKREAPAIVRVDDIYYMISSACSGWSPNQCMVSTATSLSGPWSPLTPIGNNMAYDTQPAQILTIEGSEKTTYLYVGDRWQDPNLFESKTIIFPMEIADGQCRLLYRERFDINFATGEWRETPTEGLFIDNAAWSVLDCTGSAGEEYAPEMAFDGDEYTCWMSPTSAKDLHHIAIDLGNPQTITGFVAGHNHQGAGYGAVKKYTFEVSNDAEHWTMVSGAEWAPYWAEVRFPAVEARYVRLTPLAYNTNNTISELKLLCSDPGYEPVDIPAYYKVGNGGWQTGNEISLQAGQKLTFGPNVGSLRGTWAFMRPDGSVEHVRELVVEAASDADAGVYQASFLDIFGHTHTVTYTVTVEGSGIEAVRADSDEAPAEYYSLDGRRLPHPAGLCLRSDGALIIR